MSGGRRRDPTWEFFSERQDQFYGKIKQNVLRARKSGDEIGFHNEDACCDEKCD